MLWLCIVLLVLLAFALLILKKKNMLNWLPHYLWQQLTTQKNKNGPTHILFCFVDHYEPQWGKPNDIEVERARVDRWCQDYPAMAKKHVDSDGKHPQHGFFYPEEEYREEHLQKLTNLCNQGYGEIEVHLHHDNDTSDNLRSTLNGFKSLLNEKFQALPKDVNTGELKYGFIHGNWCLDNSRPDGRWCGVNDELIVLKETGCYADFTFPSAPSDTQPSKVNSIYYAKDDPLKPKSHNRGKNVKVGGQPWGDLMIIQGPIGLNWKDRKWGFMPRIEASDIRRETPPTNDRVDLWIKANIHVKGRPDWVFVKIHTHGTQDRDMDTVLGKPVDDMFTYLGEHYNDGENYRLHYVTAREMYNIAKAAEAGEEGDPNRYRDYELTLSSSHSP